MDNDKINKSTICKKMTSSPKFIKGIIYYWPFSQNCCECVYGQTCIIGQDYEENYRFCDEYCEDNDGDFCPKKISIDKEFDD